MLLDWRLRRNTRDRRHPDTLTQRQCLPSPTGHWMHHTGTWTGAAAHLPQGGVPADAGLLAAGTAAEDGHQGDPQPPADPGQEPAGLLGHPGLKEAPERRKREREMLHLWSGESLWTRFEIILQLVQLLLLLLSRPQCLTDKQRAACAPPPPLLLLPHLPAPLPHLPSFCCPGNLSNVYQSVCCLSEVKTDGGTWCMIMFKSNIYTVYMCIYTYICIYVCI